MKFVEIRTATVSDAEEILHIYEPYVRETAITFEYDVPSIYEFRERIKSILHKYPYLVAVYQDEIVGYAYAGKFHSRAAYSWSAEISIYVSNKMKKSGIGGRLFKELEARLKKMGVINLYACIAYTETADEYLTNNSVEFHEHMGFQLIGRFHKCGYKFNRWYDMVWMEKMIGEHKNNQQAVMYYND